MCRDLTKELFESFALCQMFCDSATKYEGSVGKLGVVFGQMKKFLSAFIREQVRGFGGPNEVLGKAFIGLFAPDLLDGDESCDSCAGSL